MRNLMRAFFFKLIKDWTFRITLFIGLGLAVTMTALYLIIDNAIDMGQEGIRFCSGHNVFVSSLSPAQNFGLAVPVNLISFTVLEFTHGTIRNKIIAGNSKGKIYFSLLLSGLTFTFLLMIAYVSICTGLGSIFGGFNANGLVVGTGAAMLSPEYLWKLSVLAILAYMLITFVAVFFASVVRGIGPCIPIVILLILVCYLSAAILGPLGEQMPELQGAADVMRILNPFYSLAYSPTVNGTITIDNQSFVTEIINTIVYSAIFIGGGFLIFKKRDVK